MGKLLSPILALVVLIAGCTHIISEQSLAKADHTITFRALQENPDANRGKLVILGGTITAVTPTNEGVRLEVMQYRLDGTEMPDTASESAGRFLVSLPPKQGYETLRPGTLVTMAGEVRGKVVKPLSGVDYTYPFIAAQEIHVVERPSARPMVSPYGGYGY